MATVNPTVTPVTGTNDKAYKFTWALTTANSDGAAIHPKFVEFADRTVYMTGTWGAATCELQGGDGSTWMPLTDAQGNNITKTSNAIEIVTEVPETVRPTLTAVGAGAAITVTLIARRSKP